MIGQSEKSGIEIESEYQLTGHPVNGSFPQFSLTVVISKMEGQKQNLAVYTLEVFIIVIEIALLIYLGKIKVF